VTVAYPGAPGAFSHEACLRFLPKHEPVPVASFAEVVDAIQGGASKFGMLPLSNNEAGDTGARALIEASGLRIVDEPVLPIHMHLLGLPSATADKIRTVVSHPVALRQCARSLADLGVKTEEAANTALAAKALASADRGVLASEAAASLYNLTILMRDMHDRPDNATTFAIIARRDA
jgi:prephenate dehydratase